MSQNQINKEDIAVLKNEISHIKESVSEIRSDVKTLLKFKWQIASIVTCISGIISLAVSILF